MATLEFVAEAGVVMIAMYSSDCPVELGFAKVVKRLTPLDRVMLALHPQSRYYWCGGDPAAPGYEPLPCACCGCANFSVLAIGLTYQHWAGWVAEHPAPTSDVDWVVLMDAWESRHRATWEAWLKRLQAPPTLQERLAAYKKSKRRI